MSPASGVRTTKDVHESWVPLLETATREVFQLMVNSSLTVPSSAEETVMDVTAMVGLAGQLCGVLSVRCSGKAAILMSSKMLGVELKEFGPDVSDALGEVCNMVAGNFKNKIPGLAEGCMLSPPTIVTGSDYHLCSPAHAPALEIKLLFENMPLVISLMIQQ
jgi:chemotaxis protein CheX